MTPDERQWARALISGSYTTTETPTGPLPNIAVPLDKLGTLAGC
jgi:hypothetical protein